MGKLLNQVCWPLVVGCWLLAIGQGAAQEGDPIVSGVLFDSAAYDAIPLMPHYDGGKGEGEAPVQSSLRPYCPVPLDQGGTGACVGFAVGYGAMTILEAIGQGTTDPAEIRRLACSPWFLYNQAKVPGSPCTASTEVEASLRLLEEQGICLLEEFDAGGDCKRPVPPAAQEGAGHRRISAYSRLFERGAAGGAKVAAVRNILAGGMPVVANLKMFRSFCHLPAGSGYWQKRPTEDYLDMHALVVVGYNDRDETFELMSSWGSAWADGGFVRIGYEDFASICLAAYSILPKDFRPPGPAAESPLAQASLPVGQADRAGAVRPAASTKPNALPSHVSLPDEAAVYLQGIFEFGQPVEGADGNFVFEAEAVRYDPATLMYATVRESYPAGTLFQLRSRAIPAGKYAYVFTCDPQGKVELHWPKSEKMAAYVPGAHALLTIPGADAALELKHSGDDFLCIVYSEEAIPDIRERLGRLGGYTAANFHERLLALFPGLLADPRLLRCEPGRMKAAWQGMRKDGTAMGVVLRVRGE